jgi:hypothetical protein
MANETSVSVSISVTKSGASVSASASKTLNMSGNEMVMATQTIGFAAAELLNLADVSTLGFLYVKNLDETNFVQLGLDTLVSTKIFAKLLAGEFCLIPMPTAAIYGLADTADVLIQIVGVER